MSESFQFIKDDHSLCLAQADIVSQLIFYPLSLYGYLNQDKLELVRCFLWLLF